MSAVRRPPRIAVIGGGAIAEGFYLPALLRRRLGSLVVVEPSADRRALLARAHPGLELKETLEEVSGALDGAIVAAPPRAHFATASACLSAGVAVLCEKPLAATAAEGRELVDRAVQAGRLLAVNNTRRLFPTSRRVAEAARAGRLGELLRIVYREGQPFDWPAATASYFRPGGPPRGVLLDRGAHVLDLVCWWIGGRPEVRQVETDSFGGPEAHARLGLRRGACEIEVELSWLYKLPNRYAVEGTVGGLRGEVYDWRNLEVRVSDGPWRHARVARKPGLFPEYAELLVESFLAALAGEAAPLVAGRDVLDSLVLLDECYERARRFEMGWYRRLEAATP
jgi:predicted dehydrogenase